jgi:hypothetical protein
MNKELTMEKEFDEKDVHEVKWLKKRKENI